MRKVPRVKQEPLFRRRILITVPPWGVPIVVLGLGIAVFTQLQVIFMAVMGILVASAVIATCVMWRMVQDVRCSLHNVLYDIENENLEYQKIEEAANTSDGSGIPRISIRK